MLRSEVLLLPTATATAAATATTTATATATATSTATATTSACSELGRWHNIDDRQRGEREEREKPTMNLTNEELVVGVVVGSGEQWWS